MHQHGADCNVALLLLTRTCMAGKLFVKNTLPSNANAAVDALEMFDLFGDDDTDLVDV